MRHTSSRGKTPGKTLLLAALAVFSLVPVPALALETAAAERETATSEDLSALVARELRYAGVARSDVARTACRERLAALGGPAVGEFFRVLRTGRLPLEDGKSGGALTAPMRDAILDVFPRLPRSDVDALLALLRGSLDRLGTDARIAAMEVLGTLGRGDTTDLLFALAQPAGDADAAMTSLERTAFEVGLGRLVAREPSVVESIRDRWGTLSGEVRACVLRALGSAKRSESMSLLLEVIAFDDGHRARAVAEVPRMAALAGTGELAALTTLVRRDLDARSPDVRRVALTAAAHLRDEEALPALIRLLESDVRGEAELAHWALHDITGLPFRAEPAVWRRWLAKEQAWHAHHGAEAREDLASKDPRRVLAALRCVSKVRLGRDQLAVRVSQVLTSPRTEVRRAACATLASLGSPSGQPALERALKDGDPGVRDAARAALEQLSDAR